MMKLPVTPVDELLKESHEELLAKADAAGTGTCQANRSLTLQLHERRHRLGSWLARSAAVAASRVALSIERGNPSHSLQRITFFAETPTSHALWYEEGELKRQAYRIPRKLLPTSFPRPNTEAFAAQRLRAEAGGIAARRDQCSQPARGDAVGLGAASDRSLSGIRAGGVDAARHVELHRPLRLQLRLPTLHHRLRRDLSDADGDARPGSGTHPPGVGGTPRALRAPSAISSSSRRRAGWPMRRGQACSRVIAWR